MDILYFCTNAPHLALIFCIFAPLNFCTLEVLYIHLVYVLHRIIICKYCTVDIIFNLFNMVIFKSNLNFTLHMNHMLHSIIAARGDTTKLMRFIEIRAKIESISWHLIHSEICHTMISQLAL